MHPKRIVVFGFTLPPSEVEPSIFHWHRHPFSLLPLGVDDGKNHLSTSVCEMNVALCLGIGVDRVNNILNATDGAAFPFKGWELCV